MKNLKTFLSIIIIISFIFLTPSISMANNCSLCDKKIYIGSQCTGCTFNQFINKLNHPCKICGQRIFFGKICKNCKEKQSDSQKNVNNKKSQNFDVAPIENGSENNNIKNKTFTQGHEKKTSPACKIWNNITNAANNTYRSIFGTNKHD